MRRVTTIDLVVLVVPVVPVAFVVLTFGLGPVLLAVIPPDLTRIQTI